MIVHQMDPEMLRELAPTIPFELLDDFMCMGNVEEVIDRLAPYATAGAEHVVLGNMTGLVGGRDELMARIPDYPRLTDGLREL